MALRNLLPGGLLAGGAPGKEAPGQPDMAGHVRRTVGWGWGVNGIGRDQFSQSFAGFVRRLASAGDIDARRVTGYVGVKAPHKSNAVEAVGVAARRKRIDAAWQQILLGTLDRLHFRFAGSARLIDARDPAEWDQVGSGLRRRDHRPADEADYDAAQQKMGVRL